MVHLRLNDGDTSRNEFINFVSALDLYPDKDDALRRLHQLAAIYKPIMKRHGLRINHLQEYEPNPEFAGRNWNAGDNIEMVLRDHSGLFLPFGMICSVFAHELAHNFQMNHSAKHTKLTRDLNQERLELQRNGYFGDGFWSGGKRLDDASWVTGESSVTNAQLPSNLCGGAWKRRGASNKRRQKRRGGGDGTTKRRKKGVPSLRTGAQTGANIERVAGNSRRYLDLPGQGSRVDGNNTIPAASAKSDSYKEDPNSTFRKRANTNAARDARAAAAMKRMAALKMEQEGAAKTEGRSSSDVKKSLERKPFDDGFESEGDAGSCTESETGSETASESETEDELIYDSSDETAPGGKCGTSSSSATTTTTTAAPSTSASADATSSSAPAPRAETDAQRKRRMEQFRRSDGGRNERQARDEWRDIVKQTQSMRLDKGAAATAAKGKQVQVQAGGSGSGGGGGSSSSSKAASKTSSKRVEDSDTEDDEIVFVSSTKKPKQE